MRTTWKIPSGVMYEMSWPITILVNYYTLRISHDKFILNSIQYQPISDIVGGLLLPRTQRRKLYHLKYYEKKVKQ